MAFFIGSAAIITLIFTVPTEIAGRQTGPGTKIAAVGFGVTVLGQLIELLFKLDNLFGDIFIGIGSVIMISGILLTIVRIAR